MEQKNFFIAGYVLFLASEIQRYKKMDQSRTFCETMHVIEPITNQYALRIIHKTPGQKIDELKNDIIKKVSFIGESDFQEILGKIDEYTATDDERADKSEAKNSSLKDIRDFIYETFDDCGFLQGCDVMSE